MKSSPLSAFLLSAQSVAMVTTGQDTARKAQNRNRTGRLSADRGVCALTPRGNIDIYSGACVRADEEAASPGCLPSPKPGYRRRHVRHPLAEVDGGHVTPVSGLQAP